MNDYNKYWDKSWKEENVKELSKYLDGYYKLETKVINIFKEHGIKTICDAGCGFGAYSLAFASNGFLVSAFDISEKSVEIATNLLKKYKSSINEIKVADILNTGYEDELFDGVVAHAVIDHLTKEDANKALKELCRITKPNGLIMLSFDIPEEDDYCEEHRLLEEGTMFYTSKSRSGMIFHPYDIKEIKVFLDKFKIIYEEEKTNRENIIIIKKAI